MGNANGTAKENGTCSPPARPARAVSVDMMANSLPESPAWPQSPPISALQVPAAPLRGADDAPSVYDHLMNDANGPLDAPIVKGITTLITWSHGGNDVAVEGSWDNWTSRKALQRTGRDHSILLILPSGIYHYKFIVDGERRHIPDLPYFTDGMGRISNILDVNDYIPENVDHVSEFEGPPSPASSYSQSFPEEEDFAKEPPTVPPQLHRTVLSRHNPEEASERPEHNSLDHLFIERGWSSQSVVALGLTHRYRSKYITMVLYKPLRT